MWDIDLYVGLLLETKRNGNVGPVTKEILTQQFVASKFGDRHFYSFADGPNPFTKGACAFAFSV